MKKIQKYLTVFFVLSFLVVNFPLNVFAWSHYPRLYGDDRYQTSKAVAEKYNSGQTDNIVITTGTNFPDALSVSTLAGKLKAPILLVNQTVSQSQDALGYISEHMANGKVWIAGGEGVIDSTFESKLTSMGNTVERVAGLDRYETCLRVAEKVSAPKGTSVFLATGENFPDALSIASVAASEGYPVILTPKDKLPDGVKNYLLKQQPSEVFIIGGTGVISESVESTVKNILPASSMRRSKIMNYKVLKDVKVFFASTNSSVLQRFFPRQKVGW
jgi:putative cell wall-binding protein